MLRFALVTALILGSPALAQHSHNHPDPKEVGQSAFAALAEIVDMLRQNPYTDWTTVDIPALQRHLVDMELLATQSVSQQTKVEGAVQFNVTGSPDVIEALHRMVPAHAPFLDAETGWITEVETTEAGVVVRVEGEQKIIKALGFHGLMTIGAHHQEHHLGIASGAITHH